MRVKSLGHDPKLGEKFLTEQDGLVLGLGKSSEQNSEPDSLAKYQTSQEAHDAQMPGTSSNPLPETEADGKKLGELRIARWKHQNKQLRKKR